MSRHTIFAPTDGLSDDRLVVTGREAEHAAKSGGRDRLAITALKRSGAPETAVLLWKDLPALEATIAALRSGSLSSGFPYDLAELARRLADPRGTWGDALGDAFLAEARRLFGRRYNHPSIPGERTEAEASLFGKTVAGLYAAALSSWKEHADEAARRGSAPSPDKRPPLAFARTLAVAQFMARAPDQ
jgi:hypothetical protein